MAPKVAVVAKSWWETVPGILTGVAAIIAAATGAGVAYKNSGPQPASPIKERYFVLDSVDVPTGNGITALHIITDIAVGGRNWSFPFPQRASLWSIGSSWGRQAYPLPPSADEISVSFEVHFTTKDSGSNVFELQVTHRDPAVNIKTPISGQRYAVYKVACPLCSVLSPALDKPVANLRFSVTDKAP